MTKLEQITNELLDRIPEACKMRIEMHKTDYKMCLSDRQLTYENLLKINEYLYALEDVGIITEYEANVLRQYMKTPKEA